MSLKISASAIALAVAGFLATSASAAPVAPAQGPKAAVGELPVETVQYYYQKRRYCWYWDGWHGPGWYWCGYHLRRGYGWGGGHGWNQWNSPPRHRHYREYRRH